MKQITFIVLLFLFNLQVIAQDIHFTQFLLAPWYINPANNGLFDGDYRMAAHYRKQYASIPAPFSTTAVHGEKKWNVKSPLTLACDIHSDRAGDNRYSNSLIRLSAAWQKKFASDTTLLVSAGLNTALNFIRVNTSGMTFSRQFNGDGFDPGQNSGENFTKEGFVLPNIDGGIIFRKQKNARSFYSLGVAVFNGIPLNRTYLKQSVKWMSLRYSNFVSMAFPVSSRVDILPSLLMQFQNKSKDIVFGGKARIWLLSADGTYLKLSGGFSWRYKDAVAIVLDADYKNYTAGISYDVTSSTLRQATAYRGGMELHIHYIIRKTPVIQYRRKDCPVFM